MVQRQGGRCAICKEIPEVGRGKGFHVDHDHVTNQIRGLLCHHCNVGLGHFKENPALLQAALSYLALFAIPQA